MTNLYFGIGKKYREFNPENGVEAGFEYTTRHVILAETEGEAGKKLVNYLNSNAFTKCWEISEINELEPSEKMGLEQRVKELRNYLPVIP